MVISDLEFYLVEIGCVGQDPPVRCVITRLATDSGVEGWGEAQIDWRPLELDGRRKALLPVLAGRSVFDIEDLLCVAALQPAPLRMAVEMASWDVIGQVAGQPLCHLLGGGYRRRIPIAVPLSGQTPHQIARLARELAEQGFHCQILRLRGDLDEDLRTVSALRHLLPERTELRLDGAGCYDLEKAWDLCVGLENQDFQFLLDPLQTQDLVQMASLRRQTTVELAVRRPINSPADLLAVVRSGAARFAIVDLRRVGGIMPARKCAAIAQAARLNASLAIGPSLGIAAAAMLQLAAATPAFSGCNECLHHHLQDDLLVEPLEIVDGMLAVPQGAGLGIEVDRKKVERYQVTGP